MAAILGEFKKDLDCFASLAMTEEISLMSLRGAVATKQSFSYFQRELLISWS